MNLDTKIFNSKKIKSSMARARDYINIAEQAETEQKWKEAGSNWFKAIGSMVIACSILFGFPYSGEWGYFRAIEKMRIVWHEGWLESAFDAAILLHFNANHDFLTIDQIQWRINICRRFLNFLIAKIEEEFKRLQSADEKYTC